MAVDGVFDGQVAVVTGGTQGLGEATARLFAERGARGVVINGRNTERGQAVVDALSAAGTEVHFVEGDLANVEDVKRIVAKADDAFGRVDALVNAARLTDRGTILNTRPDLFDHMFAVNVRALFFLMQDAVKIMRRERIEGAMVNILSMSGLGGRPFFLPTWTRSDRRGHRRRQSRRQAARHSDPASP